MFIFLFYIRIVFKYKIFIHLVYQNLKPICVYNVELEYEGNTKDR